MSATCSIDTNSSSTTAKTIVPTQVNPEQAVSFAVLILADDNVDVTPEKLQTLLRAAGVTEIEPIWTTLFANALNGKDVKAILTTIGSYSPAQDNAPAHARDCSDPTHSASEPDGMDIGFESASDGDAMCTMGFFD